MKIVDLLKGTKYIPCVQVYKLKLNSDGTVGKYEARIVVKGFYLQEGVYIVDNFNSLARKTTVWAVLIIAAEKNMLLA